MLELAESRGAPINWAALERKFNLTCSPVTTNGVSIDVLIDLSELTTKLVEKIGRPLALNGIMLFPVICDRSICVRSDKITHKRKDNAYFVARNIDFEVWKHAQSAKRLMLAVQNFESCLSWIPERHLPGDDRALLLDSLRKAATEIGARSRSRGAA